MTIRTDGLLLSGCLALSLFAAGCSGSKAETRPTGPTLTRADMQYSNIYLEPITISPQGVKETEPGPLLATTQPTCQDLLAKTGLFDNVKTTVPSPPGPGALIVRAELTSLRIVGGGARFWLGAMAGSSDMRLSVILIDAATNKPVGRSEISKDSNAFAGAWTFGGVDKDVPAQVGARLADFVIFSAKKM
jgi:hypothetical protein